MASPLRVTDSSVGKNKSQIQVVPGHIFLPFAEKLVIAAKQADLTSSLGSLSESRIDLNAPDLTISAAISPAKRRQVRMIALLGSKFCGAVPCLMILDTNPSNDSFSFGLPNVLISLINLTAFGTHPASLNI
jgi:hypothetical protein